MRRVLVALVGVACSACADGPNLLTGPSTASAVMSPAAMVPTADPPPSPVVTPPPVLASECRGIHHTTSHMSANGLSVVVKNRCAETDLESSKNYVFALFRIAPDGKQTRVAMTELKLKPGDQATLTLPAGQVCYQTDLFTEITIARIESGVTKINPGEERQAGYVSPISGKMYEINGGCAPPPVLPPPPPPAQPTPPAKPC